MSVLPRSAISTLVFLTLTACGNGSVDSAKTSTTPSDSDSPSASSNAPKCPQQGDHPLPGWVPADLPLPTGTSFTKPVAAQGGYSEGLFVVPMSTSDFAKFVLKAWPQAGYHLGRGDAESGEAEDQFAKGSGVGAFKVQDRYCRDPSSIMLLIWANDRARVGVPGTEGGSPLPGREESPSP